MTPQDAPRPKRQGNWKPGPGRPRGSKNSSTLLAEQVRSAGVAAVLSALGVKAFEQPTAQHVAFIDDKPKTPAPLPRDITQAVCRGFIDSAAARMLGTARAWLVHDVAHVHATNEEIILTLKPAGRAPTLYVESVLVRAATASCAFFRMPRVIRHGQTPPEAPLGSVVPDEWLRT